MEETEIDILIAKVLSGEANGEEQTLLDAWRSERAANESYFLKSRHAFGLFSGADFAPATEAAWQRMTSRISGDEGRVVPLRGNRQWFKAAAAFLLIASLTVLLTYVFNANHQDMKIVAVNEIKQQDLPDGSVARVEKNSSVTYSEAGNGERIVRLKGSAHFKVVHNEQKPFVVQVQDLLVKDIGTAFQVSESSDGNSVSVKVDEGVVQFYSAKNSGMRLVQGESGVYDRITGSFKKALGNTVEAAAGFGSRLLQFRDSRLSEVLARVNAAYGSNVVLENSDAGNCRLSVEFNNQPFEIVMDVITETLELKQRQQGDTLILSGNGCN